jgi:hypothetical protein
LYIKDNSYLFLNFLPTAIAVPAMSRIPRPPSTGVKPPPPDSSLGAGKEGGANASIGFKQMKARETTKRVNSLFIIKGFKRTTKIQFYLKPAIEQESGRFKVPQSR